MYTFTHPIILKKSIFVYKDKIECTHIYPHTYIHLCLYTHRHTLIYMWE